MKRIKTFSILLSAMITFSLSSNAYGQDINTKAINLGSTIVDSNQSNSKISKEDAKAIARKTLSDYFDITVNDTDYQTNVNFTPNYINGPNSKNYLWQISWNSNSQEKSVNINVTVDADSGKVTSVNNYSYSQNQTSKVATLTEDQAQKVGEDFLKKINPKEFSQLKFVQNSSLNNLMKGNTATYDFRYIRIANGIPFVGDYLNISVDGTTGKISSYNIKWSDNAIPEISKDTIITQDKANQLFKDNLKFQPTYIVYRDPYGMGDTSQNLKLVYTLDTSNGISIDAKTGTMMNNTNTTAAAITIKDLDATQKTSFTGSYKAVPKLSKELDSSSAEAIMNQIIKELYGDTFEIQSTNYQDYNNNGSGNNVSSWSGQFQKKDSTNMSVDSGSISIDSLTGSIISINKFNPYGFSGSDTDNSEPKLTWDQAYDKAIATVEKYFPDKVKDINTKQVYIPSQYYINQKLQPNVTYDFNFNRLINNISYQNDNINVGFDSKTGEINRLYSSWSQNLQVPSSDGIMSQEDAQKIFFAKYSPELSYSLINTSTDIKNPVMEVKLVYSIDSKLQFSQANNIDAFTGKFIDYNGQEIDNNIDDFKSKIKGNPLEKELSILASQGIINTKDFDLNKQITRLDLIKMLVNLKGYRPYYLSKETSDLKIANAGSKGDETYKYLQMAVNYGILDNSGSFNGSEKISREEMIKDIVCLAGYKKLAEAKDIFALSYSDISDITPTNIGYIAIAKGLGLNNDTDNKFRPKDLATITDAAFSIYKVMDGLRIN